MANFTNDTDFFEMIEQMLQLNPAKRISAEEVRVNLFQAREVLIFAAHACS